MDTTQETQTQGNTMDRNESIYSNDAPINPIERSFGLILSLIVSLILILILI